MARTVQQPREPAHDSSSRRSGNKILQNATPKRLVIKGAGDHALVMSPLERTRVISPEELELFDFGRLRNRGLINIRDEPPTAKIESILSLIPGAGVFYGIAGAYANKSFPEYWWVVGIALVIAFMVAIMFQSRGIEVVSQGAAQLMSFLLILLTAVGLPAAAVYFFGGGPAMLSAQGGLIELGRWLQLLFIAIASILPGLLYFLFDRQQLATLRERFEQQIFRLDPHVTTLSDVRAKYGRQMEEVYGREQASGHSRLSRGKRWPIFVATMIITLGWILALAPVSPAPNGEGLSLQTGADLVKLFIPNNHPVILGFLGAYFFALNTVLRRYVRRDLKPSAYATITVRIFIAVILAWLLALLSVDPGVVGILAFFVGIVPDTGIALLQETLRKNSGIGRFIPTYKEDHPLTKLEGIDLYERARLEDEGVTNVQSLAHHDLIDLMIETRIPVPRLVDWVDQAILYLHVHRMEDKEPSWTNNFNAVGIRNASDLLRVYSDADRNPTEFDFETIVREQARIKQLHALMSSLHDDEWLDHVLHWRKPYKVETVVRSAEPRLPIDIHPEQDMPPAQASPKAVPLGLITDEAPAGTS